MAFCVKSSKDTLQITSQTPSKVGPGSYTTVITQSSHNQISKKNSKVPFSTSVDRFNQYQLKELPGPGSYEIKDLKQNNTSPKSNIDIFISNEERFSNDLKSKLEFPGPGTYIITENDWIKDKYYKINYPIEKRIDFKRLCTIPSIPGKDHVNGYEEDEHGNIYIKKNEEFEIDELNNEIVKNKYTNFGNSKTERKIFNQNETSGPGPGPGPGPGQYDICENYKLNRKTSCFASKSKLTHQQEAKEYDKLRGPGDYNQILLKNNINIKKPKYSKKKYQNKIIKKIIETPGPGQYYQSESKINTIRPCTLNKIKAGFNQTSSRFQKINQNRLGPGEYKIENKWEIKISKRHLRSGFGSTDDKLKEMINTPSPGPCAYQPNFNNSNKKTYSPFKSKSSRFIQIKGPTIPDYSNIKETNDRPRGDPNALGPGSYKISQNINKLDFCKFSGFWSSSNRFSIKYNTMVPGPGKYNYNYSFDNYSFDDNIKERCFSYDKRFKDDMHKLNIPGPGYYNYNDKCMIKKSFNVTFV